MEELIRKGIKKKNNREPLYYFSLTFQQAKHQAKIQKPVGKKIFIHKIPSLRFSCVVFISISSCFVAIFSSSYVLPLRFILCSFFSFGFCEFLLFNMPFDSNRVIMVHFN